MGCFKTILDIAHESIDLFENLVIMEVMVSQLRFYADDDSFCVTVIFQPNGVLWNRLDMHHELTEDFDEYTLCDLIERAARGGFDHLYLQGKIK